MGVSKHARNRRRGIAIIITALMLTFLIPLVGLTIDAGSAYMMRAKVQAATDAASMAAARNLAVGQTLADQTSSATARAQAYLNANLPDGVLGITKKSTSVTVAENGYRTRKVSVQTTVEMPTFFMNYLGKNKMFISSRSETSRRDVNVMMVIDRSGSLDSAGACDDVESAAIAFTNLFANGRDRLGLITYGASYRVDYTPTMNFKDSPSLVATLGNIHPNGCNGWTGSAQALWNGYQQLVNLNEPGALNVILFFTDGQPNTITALWNVKTLTTTTSPTAKSHCWDWQNNKRYDAGGWNPTTQQYLGAVSADNSAAYGIFNHAAGTMPVSSDPWPVKIPNGYSGTAKSSSDDCYYRSDDDDVDRDIPYYPNTDYYGNSVFGYKTVNVFPVGHAYAGKVRTDSGSNMRNAGINAVDNAGQRILNKELNAGISVVVYAVGLGGAGAAEHELLRRIANDKDSPIYDENKAQGMYVYAPTSAQLNDAFYRIASEILRISR